MTTIETILADIDCQGWLVNSLHQLDNGTWVSNLRKGWKYTTICKAETLEEALFDAAVSINDEGTIVIKKEELIRVHKHHMESGKEEKMSPLREQLKDLLPKKPPLDRRF